MHIDDFLARQAANYNRQQRLKRADRKARLISAIFYAVMIVLSAISFATFGWTAANIPGPALDPNFPFPAWVWTYSMWAVAIGMLAGGAFCTVAMLDELAYPKH